MLKNYFIVAIRNIRNSKLYAFLNIAGLAVGLASFLLVCLYIFDEFSFDNFHQDYENIYHVGLHVNYGGQEAITAASCPPLSFAMTSSIPGVEQVTRIKPWKDVIRYQETAFTESNAFFVDSNFFEFFSFRLLEGNAKTVLQEPNTLVLTKSGALKYFGTENALGNILSVGRKKQAYKVTGVAEDPPANSHIQFTILLSSQSNKSFQEGGWGDNNIYTYYRKNSKTAVESIDQKLRDIVLEHIAPELEEGLGISFSKFESQGGFHKFFSYPISKSHLYYPEIQDGPGRTSDIKYVYIIGSVGLFILVIACINFMNLSTARFSSRAKEVGLRKTLGSARSTLIIQFLSESFIYVFASLLIALVAVYFLLPSFNILAGKILLFNSIFSPKLVLSIIAIFLVVGLLAGSYPAFYLTSFNPVEVLRGKIKSGSKSKGIRSSLVIMQFVISIALIICTLVVQSQLSYMQNKDIGFDKYNVLILQNTRRLGNNQQAFREAVSNKAGIIDAGYISDVFPGENVMRIFRLPNTTRDILINNYNADYNLLNVLKIDLKEGRYFSEEFKSDTTACVVNEAAVKYLGWSNPTQQKLISYDEEQIYPMEVIGVVKDFNFESFRNSVKPIVIQLRKSSDNMLIRYQGNPQEVVATVSALWKQHTVNEPFEHNFLDQNFDQLFREEQRLGNFSSVMSGIVIFVACLGLFGLASFTAEQRTKEIGIRKVMGASISSIHLMLLKEFMILVAIAFIISAGTAWYIMNDWLSTFAYKTHLGPLVFLISGFSAALIASLTVSYHLIKAARSNPAKTLKWE